MHLDIVPIEPSGWLVWQWCLLFESGMAANLPSDMALEKGVIGSQNLVGGGIRPQGELSPSNDCVIPVNDGVTCAQRMDHQYYAPSLTPR